MLVHLNGQFLPKDQARISPDDRGFLFADGAYEVVRAYRGHLFRAREHWDRFDASLQALRIARPAGLDYSALCTELLQRNQLAEAEATVYLQVSRGAAPRKHAFPAEVAPTVYGFAAPFANPVEKWAAGVKVITVPDQRWARCDIKSISLLPNVLANQLAQEAGAHEAVLVRDGFALEGSLSNFAVVMDGVVCTAPRSNYILPGVTRLVALGLCAAMGIPVKEFPTAESELRCAQEAMLFGTTNEVMPVVQINDRKLGDGQPGPITRRLQQAFRDYVAECQRRG
ncbi:MAG: aminotransferase [Pedosphaera sp. Tous-C6FEB]|nr:MAG: aminotransferase [Pedosphaera sp. Tous-C6FEB]